MSHSLKVKTFWQKEADNYDTHMQDTGHYNAQRKIIKSLIKYIHSPVFDLASGPGFIDGLLLKNNFNVVINDFAINMVSLSKKKYSRYPNAQFKNQNAEKLKINKKYKTIICCNLLYYLDNKERAITNWDNHLLNNGNIIVIEEYPFQKPSASNMKKSGSELMKLISPISPTKIRKYFKKFNLLIQKNVAIDKKHDLYGFVFRKF